MTIYIEDNQYAGEIKRQMVELASPQASAVAPQFLAPVPLNQAYLVENNSFIQVVYSRPAQGSSNDLGTLLLQELANHKTENIYVHGVAGDFGVASSTPEPGKNDRHKMPVANQGGGSTTNVYNAPHVDVFLDGTPGNTSYSIPIVAGGHVNALPYVRMYHEFVHAAGLIFGCAHGHWTSYPQTNEFRKQRGLGYQRKVGWADTARRSWGNL